MKKHHYIEDVKAAWSRRRDGLVIDRKIDVAFLVLWSLYAGWGWTSAAVNTTILDMPITFYPTIWGAVIGLSATVATGSILSSFFLRPDQYKERVLQKRVEVAAVGLMVSFIAVHPVNQIVSLFTGHPERPDSAILALSYLVMPAFRIMLQLDRAQQIKAADKQYLTGLRPPIDPEEWTGRSEPR